MLLYHGEREREKKNREREREGERERETANLSAKGPMKKVQVSSGFCGAILFEHIFLNPFNVVNAPLKKLS